MTDITNDFRIVIPVLDNENFDKLGKPETEGSAGIDLRYCGEDRVLKPLERGLFDTGIKMAIPKGCVGLVCPRSGLALKQGLTVLNAPGIIDSDYRNSVGVILVNLSNEPVEIHSGDRIAQLVICEYKYPNFMKVSKLNETDRGMGGFGHTGVQ